MSSGSEFHTTGPELQKFLGPKWRDLVRDTIRSPRTADRRFSPGADLRDRDTDVAEVCRTPIMEGVADENRDLEIDTLTNGKPVELIPKHRSDVVELSFVRDQPGCCVEKGLQFSDNNVLGTLKILLQYFTNTVF